MLGENPTYPGYGAIWNAGASDYSMLTTTSNTFINAPTGNTYIRQGNADRLVVTSNGAVLYGASPILTLRDNNNNGTLAASYVSFTTSNGTRVGYVGDPSGGNDDMYVKSDTGIIRLVATAAGGYVFVDGATSNCSLGNATGAVSCSSDRRLKQNISTLQNSLDKITQLRGVNYEWKVEPGTTRTGLIAQEIQEVYPEIVSVDPEGMLMVDYAPLVAPLIEAVKTLKGFIETIRQEIATLSATSNAHQAEIDKLKSENKMMKDYLCKRDATAPFCNP